MPPHVNLFYCFGGLALAALLLQFASGGALTAYFRPAVLDSLAGELGARLDYGWFPRGLHRVSSSFVLFFTLLHASRVFFTGGQLRPRELTWLSGLSLAPLGSAFGVSGYTLPWDSAGPWALQVVSAIPAPLDLYRAGAGTLAVQALRGGPALGQPSLSRCFLAHTLLLPFFILPALALHLALVRKAGVSGPLQLFSKSSASAAEHARSPSSSWSSGPAAPRLPRSATAARRAGTSRPASSGPLRPRRPWRGGLQCGGLR